MHKDRSCLPLLYIYKYCILVHVSVPFAFIIGVNWVYILSLISNCLRVMLIKAADQRKRNKFKKFLERQPVVVCGKKTIKLPNASRKVCTNMKCGQVMLLQVLSQPGSG